MTSFQWNFGCLTRHQFEKGHWKNRWSSSSLLLLRKAHCGSTLSPQRNLSFVASLFWIASHPIKVCLGICLGNQTSFQQLTSWFLLLMWFQVSAQELCPDLDRIETGLSSSPNIPKPCLLCRFTKFSDLAGFQIQFFPYKTLETLALKLLVASYIALCPYFLYRMPSGCHQSCQRNIFLPEPTSNLMKVLAFSRIFWIFL